MTDRTRWRLVPESTSRALLWLVIGLLLLFSAILQFGNDVPTPALPIISAVFAAALIVLSVAGLVATHRSQRRSS